MTINCHRRKMKIPLTFILLVVQFGSSQQNRYCELENCPDGSHTLCKFHSEEVADLCGKDILRGLSPEQISQIFDQHLWAKERAAMLRVGLEKRNRGRRLALQWDIELKNIAQAWADQCQERLDQCRHVARFDVEQKVAAIDVVDGIFTQSLDSVVNNWYNRDPHVMSLSSGSNDTGTRTMWESATKIGCGSVLTSGPRAQFYIVCNFAPVDYKVYFNPYYIWY